MVGRARLPGSRRSATPRRRRTGSWRRGCSADDWLGMYLDGTERRCMSCSRHSLPEWPTIAELAKIAAADELTGGSLEEAEHYLALAEPRQNGVPHSQSARKEISMKTASPATSVLDEVTAWPGISTRTTSRGATAIVFERHELGHIHPNRATLDMPFPDDRRADLLNAGTVEGMVPRLGQQATRKRRRRKRRHRATAPKLRRATSYRRSAGGEVKSALRRRQRDVHHREVEHDHELCDSDHSEHLPPPPPGGGVRNGSRGALNRGHRLRLNSHEVRDERSALSRL